MDDGSGETGFEYAERYGMLETIPDQPEVPPVVEHLVELFWKIGRKRKSGPEPIAWADIDAWLRLTDSDLTPDEVEAIMAMDDTYIAEVHKARRAYQERKAAEPKG